METWKNIGSFAPGYSASTLGRIRNDKSGTTLCPTMFDRGYLYVNIMHNGKRGCVTVHKVVNIAFHGIPKDGQITRHLNCNRTDNRPENLRWGTYKENAADGLRNGRTAHGHRMNHGHLTDEQIIAIREARAAGASIQMLGEKYKVAWAHISAICTGKWWVRVGGPRTVGFRAHRTEYARGERSAGAKMTNESVLALRTDREEGLTYSELSEKYGICGSRACRIVHGRGWSHI